MAKNFHSPGEVIDVTAPGPVVSGQALLIGSLFGVAATDAKTGEPVALHLTGVWRLPKAAGDIAPGAPVYWDADPGILTGTGQGNVPIGAAAADAGADDADVLVRLNGVSLPAAAA